MSPRWLLVLVLAFTGAGPAAAQAPRWQFRWAKGDVLLYRTRHVINAAETFEGTKVASTSTVSTVKEWKVADVDGRGVATLHLALVSMRNEQKRPDGEVLLYDSDDLPKSTPELREQMGKFLGTTLAVLQVDGFGRVLAVKQGSAERYEAEPPFALNFPPAEAKAGQVWTRPYTITLAPPQGTGEKYQAEQRCECAKIEDGKATIAITTVFKTQPESAQERLPFLQKDLTGLAVIDVAAGRLVRVSYRTEKTVENHQGAGSSYRFQSEYTEELEPAPVRVHGGVGP